jgi:L-ascorbate metabolism protein UlaG (beta-lactamase superfamily)
VKHLAAVIPQHSHIDHAMDAPEIARLTGAVVMGSPSTANIARGWGLPESQIRVVRGGEVLHLGRFELEFVHSVHAPTGFTGGEITQPLVPPVRATAYKEGESYSLLVRHGSRRLLLQASAGFVPGALQDRRADVVFLGVGTLGKQDDAYLDRYWRETVQAVHARRVVPVHWDDFLRPLDQPLVPGSRLFDRFDRTMAFLQQRGAQQGVDVKLVPTWQRIDPFAGL